MKHILRYIQKKNRYLIDIYDDVLNEVERKECPKKSNFDSFDEETT